MFLHLHAEVIPEQTRLQDNTCDGTNLDARAHHTHDADDADLRTDDVCGGGQAGRTMASAAVMWGHPLLIASDPDKDLRYYLWEEYETDDEEGLNPATAAWRLRLATPYLIRRVTAAPRRVGPGRHLHVSGTVMVAANAAACVAGLRDGYRRV